MVVPTASHLAPMPIADIVARIHADRPGLVCAPHVETSAGMMLPDDYIRAVADAVHAGRQLVLDCVASAPCGSYAGA